MPTPEELAKQAAQTPVKITVPLWIVLGLMVATGMVYLFLK